MCYDLRYLTQKQEVYARRFGVEFKAPESASANIINYHALGYDHPELPIVTSQEPATIDFYQWGLIPHWVKDPKQAVTIQNSTLNARGEELQQKPSFKDAIRLGHRCLVLVDGFYEHHHKNGKIFPYHIKLKHGEPFAIGGLFSKWDSVPGHERNTCTIITTVGNTLLATIHNNPKLKGPRMPFVVPKNYERKWIEKDLDPAEVLDMIQPYKEQEMEAYSVRRLRGKEALGNSALAIEKFDYPELISSQGSLF